MLPDQTIPAFVSLTGPQALFQVTLLPICCMEKWCTQLRILRKLFQAVRNNVATVLRAKNCNCLQLPGCGRSGICLNLSFLL